MSREIQSKSPWTGEAVVVRSVLDDGGIDEAIARGSAAQKGWKLTGLEARIKIVEAFLEAFLANGEAVAREISMMMGRPIRYCKSEVAGVEERARYMIKVARESLATVQVEEKAGFKRYIQKSPIGLVFIMGAWNYPYLIQVNGVIPAILAGNSVILKPSPQTLLSGERFAEAFQKAGLPDGVFQSVVLDIEGTQKIIKSPRVNFVNFTGSVATGKIIQGLAANSSFKGCSLELGGKDSAYVMKDADLVYTAAELADGAFFNSGQSCCAIERIYVHEEVYEAFLEKLIEVAKTLKLDDPADPEITLGPVVSAEAARTIKKQIKDAIDAGAKAHLPTDNHDSLPLTCLPPQILTQVDHSMAVMSKETFGPVVGVMKVRSDEEAIKLMNDSEYGLTASIWTRRPDDVEGILQQLEAGTVLVNRCDYLDPALPWSGVKNSGRGHTLSRFGFDSFVKLKSFHIKQ